MVPDLETLHMLSLATGGAFLMAEELPAAPPRSFAWPTDAVPPLPPPPPPSALASDSGPDKALPPPPPPPNTCHEALLFTRGLHSLWQYAGGREAFIARELLTRCRHPGGGAYVRQLLTLRGRRDTTVVVNVETADDDAHGDDALFFPYQPALLPVIRKLWKSYAIDLHLHM